jgi:hypothetical protein
LHQARGGAGVNKYQNINPKPRHADIFPLDLDHRRDCRDTA